MHYNSTNFTATAIRVIAILEMIAGLIVGIGVGIDWRSWGIFFAYFGGGLVVGFFTLGFAEIIMLLQVIVDRS